MSAGSRGVRPYMRFVILVLIIFSFCTIIAKKRIGWHGAENPGQAPVFSGLWGDAFMTGRRTVQKILNSGPISRWQTHFPALNPGFFAEAAGAVSARAAGRYGVLSGEKAGRMMPEQWRRNIHRITLAKDQSTDYRIVVAESAQVSDLHAAEELANFLHGIGRNARL